MAFRHAAHERRTSLNVVCGLAAEGGLSGWGECLPRAYVTGESAEDVHRAIAEAVPAFDWPAIESRDDLLGALERVADDFLPDHPSGRCAVEVALLDLGARALNIPATDVVAALAQRLGLPLRDACAPVVHSGVIGAGSLISVTRKALKMRLFGLRQIKVKVGDTIAEDIARVRRLRRVCGRRTDLRVDANGAWSFEEAVAAIAALATFGISSVEQPLPRGQEHRLADLRRAVPVPVALDESLTSLDDARRAIEGNSADLFNIRLSKCGGVVSALRILAEAHRAGLRAWLGCMVGESGILSAAGRAFACAVEGLVHLEGAYDHHLFGEFLTTEPVGFGRRGLGRALTGPGLGVAIDPAVLNRWTRREDHVDLP